MEFLQRPDRHIKKTFSVDVRIVRKRVALVGGETGARRGGTGAHQREVASTCETGKRVVYRCLLVFCCISLEERRTTWESDLVVLVFRFDNYNVCVICVVFTVKTIPISLPINLHLSVLIDPTYDAANSRGHRQSTLKRYRYCSHTLFF